jgi:hypothetical protein
MELFKMKSVGSDEVSDMTSDSSCDPRWWRRLKAGCVTLMILLVVTGGVLYWVAVSMDPSLGPESYRVRSVGKTAAKYLSSDPDVVSAKVDHAEADKSGSVVSVGASLKDGTSVHKAADLVASVQRRTLEKEPKYGGTLEVSLSWKIGGNDIDVTINCRRDANRIRADILRAINPAGEPKAIKGDIEVFSPDAFVEGEDDQGCGGDRGDGSGIEGDVLEGLEVLDQGVGPLGGSPH